MYKHTLLVIGILTVFSYQLVAQNQKLIDSLQTILSNSSEVEKFDIYLKLAFEMQKNTPDKAADYLKKAEKLVDLDKKTNQTFRYYATLSRNKLYEHEYKDGLLIANKSLNLQDFATAKERIQVYSTIGTCHYYTSKFQKAINTHLEALRISDEDGLEDEKANIFNNISVVFIAMGEWEKTEKYLTKALNIANRFRNSKEGSRARGNMAILFAMQEKYELAEKWFKKDLEFNKKNRDKFSASKNYNNLGVLYERQKKQEVALEHYQIALDMALEIDDKASIALGYQNVANVLGNLKRYDEALKNYKIGLAMTRTLGNRNILRDGLLNISELYEAQGSSKKALDYHQQYHLLNDSIINEQHLNAVSELEIKYETEKKEKDILVLSEQNLLDEAAIAKQNIWIRRLSVGLLGAILLFGAAFIIFRQRARSQKQEELISAIADTQIAERKRIAQDLHDSIGGSIALTKNKLQSLYEKDKNHSKELGESLETLTKTGEQVRQISHNLMPGELVKFGLVSAVQTILDQLRETELKAQLYAHDMEKRIDPTKEIHLFRILQEIIQNVLKHANADQLNVYLNKHKKYLNLMVEDDGVGMAEYGEPGTGMGLNNIKARVAFLKGTFDIDSGKGKGTTMNIQIPL